jgi:hypothetical protein
MYPVLGVLENSIIAGLKIDTTYKFASRVGVYVPLPAVIERLEPHHGVLHQPIQAVATGFRLRDITKVVIGDTECQFESTVAPFRSLRLSIPPRATAGSLDIIVHTVHGGAGVCLAKFTYHDEKHQGPFDPVILKPDDNLRPTHYRGFRSVRSVLITAMTDTNYIVHSEFSPDDKNERTLAIIERVLRMQVGKFHLQSVCVDNARKLTPQ